MLIPTKHSGYQAGIRLYPGGKGGDAPPPDPRLVEGQLKSMGIQDDAIKQIMQNSADMAPLQKESMQFGLDSSKTAYDQSQQDRTWMLGRRGELSTLQDTQVKDATDFNTEARREELAGQATADVNAGFSSARAQNGRAMARMGVNPSSGKALAIDNQTAITQAAALAGAATNARTSARLEGRALTDRATNTLSGYPSMATTATGAGANIGASGITIANTGLAGLNSGSMQAGQVAGSMGSNAAGMYGTMGNYKTGQDKVANDSGNSTMSTIGTVAGAALAAFSDRRLKERIVLVGRDDCSGLNLYEFNYITDPAHRFRGVMADEVAAYMPQAVTYNSAGFASVDYAMIGIDMMEVLP